MSNTRLSCTYVPIVARCLVSWYYADMSKMHAGRRFDLWWEDPFKWTNHLRDSGESQVLLSHYKLQKAGLDPREFMKEHFHGLPWKCYIFHPDSTVLIDYTCAKQEIKGAWPAWNYEDYDLDDLQELIEHPWADRRVHPISDWWEVPHQKQKHRIFIYNVLAGYDKHGRSRRQRLTKIQRLYPEVELFIKPKDFNMGLMFGCGFSAGCLDPYRRRGFDRGAVYLPNGKRVHLERCQEFRKEIEYFGFDAHDVQWDQDVGLLYTIATTRYAAHHWDDPTGPFYAAKGKYRTPDFHNPDMYAAMPSYERISFNKDKIKETDKILCDSCALWRLCPAYRTEEVCGVAGTEGKRLSELALSRNADDVVSMLGSIVSKQAERVEKKIEDEKFTESGYDKDVDKMLNNLFKNGTALAKLLDPTLGRPLVQINAQLTPQQQQAQKIAAADPRALAMSVIQEIEATGVKREDITEQMIEDYIKSNHAQPQLEGEVVDAEVE